MVYRNVALPSCVSDTDVNERERARKTKRNRERPRETKTDRNEDAVSLEKNAQNIRRNPYAINAIANISWLM